MVEDAAHGGYFFRYTDDSNEGKPAVDPKIQELVNKVPDWRGRPVEVTELSGGITNQNYRVDVDGASYVLRVCSDNTAPLGIKRDHEYACSKIAAGLGIGAEVFRYQPEDGILIVGFIDAKPISAAEARKPETLRRIVETIRRVHDGPRFPGRFSPFDTVRDYHRLAGEAGVSFPETLPGVFELMERIESALSGVQRSVPCHNDLLAANFLDDGRKIWVIDWEYAAMGDPFFDLGNFTVNQELDGAQAERLLGSYFGEVRRRDLAHLNLMKLASDLRESFWGFLQSGIATLDFDYSAYAEKHLDRFLAGASALEFDAWLEEARRKG